MRGLPDEPPTQAEPRPPLAVQTRGLTRSFGDAVAVDHLNLEVPTGCFLGFLGANGAGKSTTIKMLTGLLSPSSGEVRILGHDLRGDAVEAKRLIGVVPEDLALHDRLTGREYLTFVGRMYGLERGTIEERGSELLQWMDLHREPRKLIVDYSHGMKKKLALAAALIHDPQLLFLDEPFEGIDVIASSQIRELLSSLLQRGVTIFLTSHVLEVVEKLCTHVTIIHRGRLVANGSLAEMRRGVDDATGRRRTLEEIFLDLVEVESEAKGSLSWLG